MGARKKHDEGSGKDPSPARSREPQAVSEKLQFSTFSVAGRLYGIDVTRVQEVVKSMAVTPVPLAPPYIKGLINLRGQVATAIGLRELFEISGRPASEMMNVVCKAYGTLLSFQVDEIGDVVEVNRLDFEATPATVQEGVRRFLGGIYKLNGTLLSVIDIEPLAKYLGLTSSATDPEAGGMPLRP